MVEADYNAHLSCEGSSNPDLIEFKGVGSAVRQEMASMTGIGETNPGVCTEETRDAGKVCSTSTVLILSMTERLS